MNIIITLLEGLQKWWRNPPVPVPPPPVPKVPIIPKEPPWLTTARGYLGFHEKPGNLGIEKLIALAKCGHLRDPWCAIAVNAWVEESGFPGTRSPAACSFESHPNFYRLPGPALGAITTMWRGRPRTAGEQGNGHVFLYLGENSKGISALGGNQDDQVCIQPEPKNRVVGYYWPKSATPPLKIGPIAVNEKGQTGGSET